MVWLDERVRGIIKEYLVAPIPRLSILLGNAGSTVSKAMFQGIVILFAVIFTVLNLLVDLTYALLNPRLRHG